MNRRRTRYVVGTLLVVAVVARGGLAAEDGTLLFAGRDSSNDPLVYAALALGLHETGLPLAFPFSGGAPTTSPYLPSGVMAGLHALGVPMLDVAMRLLPLVDAASLALAAVALVRALGGSPAAAALGGTLVVLGGEPSLWLRLLGAQHLDTWTFFGPYLFAFNPGAAALQLAFAAMLLVITMGPDPRRAGWVVGLLVAAVFETKLFVWAPLFAGLLGVALVAPPPSLASGLRRAAAVAGLAVLPSLVEKLAWARALAGREVTGLVACPGCLPRYLADAAFGSRELSFALFEGFTATQLLEPGVLVGTFAGVALLLAVALGARTVALPALRHGSRGAGAAPGRAAACRWIGLAAALGLAGALVFTTRPHYLNGAQFAWIATCGLWPFAAPTLGRWWSGRRIVPLVLVAALVLPGTWHALVRLGFAAPGAVAVSSEELALVRELRSLSAPDEVVLEPSMLQSTDFPSPVTWHAGRPVYLSLLSAAQLLPEPELFARHERLVAVFAGTDRAAAAVAIRESGARWLYAPAAWPLRFEPGPELAIAVRNPAGVVYRVVDGP